MSEELDDDISSTWNLRRSKDPLATRFHLAVEITATFVEPTRDEVRDALAQVLDEALGPEALEIAGWDDPGEPDHFYPADELERLRSWKAEALPLLEILDACHELLDESARAPLGHSKAQAVYDFIRDVT